jgi:uncharacterized protein YndB with AHSA1/START domain
MSERVGSITGTVTIEAPVERAFRVFTEGMGTWWPLQTHSIAVDQELGQRAVALRVDPREGGSVEEVLEDGSARWWAEITWWEPPRRVVFRWKPNDLPTPPTELEVRFMAEGDRTRVDVEHRGWEDLGEFADRIRPLYASDDGWPLVLGLFAQAAEA